MDPVWIVNTIEPSMGS